MQEERWFESVYEENYRLLYAMGKHLLGASASWENATYDAIQEVFLALWRKRETLMQHENIGGWLVNAFKYQALDRRRKGARDMRHHAYSLDEAPETHSPPEDERARDAGLDTVLYAEKIAALKALLGEENAEIFLAYTLEHTPAKELAERYGISEAGIWMRVNRMKKKILEHPEMFYLLLLLALGFPR